MTNQFFTWPPFDLITGFRHYETELRKAYRSDKETDRRKKYQQDYYKVKLADKRKEEYHKKKANENDITDPTPVNRV